MIYAYTNLTLTGPGQDANRQGRPMAHNGAGELRARPVSV